MRDTLINVAIVLAISAIYMLVATLDERALATPSNLMNSNGDQK